MKSITIDELKQIQLDIMQAVHDYCLQQGLHYSLAYGTLIGAVRHKGFIPWDDDIDIMMPRTDYDRLVKGFSHPYYKLYDYSSDPEYVHPYAKVADTRTLLAENTNAKDLGINIDVFPVENMFDTPEQCTAFLSEIRQIKKRFRMKMLRPSKKNVWWKRIAIRLSKLLVLGQTMRGITQLQVNRVATLTNNQSRYVAIVNCNDCSDNYLRSFWPREWFDSYITVPFEDRQFQIIENFDPHLRQLFGEYMTPPPASQRTSPHTLTRIYWK